MNGIAGYGDSAGTAFGAVAAANGSTSAGRHPPVILGWSYREDGEYRLHRTRAFTC